MGDIEILLFRATTELACQVCRNNPRGQLKALGWDECSECHGQHRNAATIALLEALATPEADRG